MSSTRPSSPHAQVPPDAAVDAAVAAATGARRAVPGASYVESGAGGRGGGGGGLVVSGADPFAPVPVEVTSAFAPLSWKTTPAVSGRTAFDSGGGGGHGPGDPPGAAGGSGHSFAAKPVPQSLLRWAVDADAADTAGAPPPPPLLAVCSAINLQERAGGGGGKGGGAGAVSAGAAP